MTITINPASITDIPSAQRAIAEIVDHLRGSIIPLDGQGNAQSSSASLGSAASPFGALHCQQLVIGSSLISDIEQIADAAQPVPQPTDDGVIIWPYSTLSRLRVVATFTETSIRLGDTDSTVISRAGTTTFTIAQGLSVNLHALLRSEYERDAGFGVLEYEVRIKNIVILAIIPYP